MSSFKTLLTFVPTKLSIYSQSDYQRERAECNKKMMFEDTHCDEIFLTRVSSIYLKFDFIQFNYEENFDKQQPLWDIVLSLCHWVCNCNTLIFYYILYSLVLDPVWWLHGVNVKAICFAVVTQCWVCIEWNNYNYQQVTIMSLLVFTCHSPLCNEHTICNHFQYISLSAPTSLYWN